MRGDCGDRGATPVVGNILLVAVVLVLGVTLVTLSFTFFDRTGAPSADGSFEYERTPAGLEIVPQAIGTDVRVQLNGQEVTTIEADSAGQRILVPTAPGDTITIVSTDEDRSVLLTEEIDERDEVGDFIAYYTFDQRSDNTVLDRSGNGNNGTATDDGNRPARGTDSAGTYMSFDENDGSLDMGELDVKTGVSTVEEVTIAIRYSVTGPGTGSNNNAIQELMQHRDGNFAWYLETQEGAYPTHAIDYTIGWNNPPSQEITTGDSIPGNSVQTVIGTFDGSEMTLYRNGKQVATKALSREVGLGKLWVGGGSGNLDQYLTGQIYEVRLYYTAFTSEQVRTLTNAMQGD